MQTSSGRALGMPFRQFPDCVSTPARASTDRLRRLRGASPSREACRHEPSFSFPAPRPVDVRRRDVHRRVRGRHRRSRRTSYPQSEARIHGAALRSPTSWVIVSAVRLRSSVIVAAGVVLPRERAVVLRVGAFFAVDVRLPCGGLKGEKPVGKILVGVVPSWELRNALLPNWRESGSDRELVHRPHRLRLRIAQ